MLDFVQLLTVLEGPGLTGPATDTRVARLAVTDALGNERREIVQLPDAQDGEVRALVDALRKTLEELPTSRAIRLMAVTKLADEILAEEAYVGGDEA